MGRPIPVSDIRQSEEHGVEVFACMKWSGIRKTACVREQATAGKVSKVVGNEGFSGCHWNETASPVLTSASGLFLPVTQVHAVRNGMIRHDVHSGADQHPPFLRSGSETEKPAVGAAWRLVSALAASSCRCSH
jgi:hypothetical protein